MLNTKVRPLLIPFAPDPTLATPPFLVLAIREIPRHERQNISTKLLKPISAGPTIHPRRKDAGKAPASPWPRGRQPSATTGEAPSILPTAADTGAALSPPA